MAQEIVSKLTERKFEVEKELESKEDLLRVYSRQVSETQVLIIELRGELKGLLKMLNSLKK